MSGYGKGCEDSVDMLFRDIRKRQVALDYACDMVASFTGTCPLDQEGVAPRDCDRECDGAKDAECWRMFFMEKASKQ